MKENNQYPYIKEYAKICGMKNDQYEALLHKVSEAKLPRDTYDYTDLNREDGQKIFRVSQMKNRQMAEKLIKESGYTPEDLGVFDGKF